MSLLASIYNFFLVILPKLIDSTLSRYTCIYTLKRISNGIDFPKYVEIYKQPLHIKIYGSIYFIIVLVLLI
jgi:hypothetical protein